VWLRIFAALAQHSPRSLHLIDSSIVRAHQHAAGGKKGHFKIVFGSASFAGSSWRARGGGTAWPENGILG
jgi:stress-induced morphogen